MHSKLVLHCRGAEEVTGGYSLTRLTSILAALTASPGAPAKFAKEGLLGEALLALAGMSAVELGRTHLTGLLIHLHLLAVLPGKLTPPQGSPHLHAIPPKAVACVCLLTPLFRLFIAVLSRGSKSGQNRGMQLERLAESALTLH